MPPIQPSNATPALVHLKVAAQPPYITGSRAVNAEHQEFRERQWGPHQQASRRMVIQQDSP
jgi:hypothetical protein